MTFLGVLATILGVLAVIGTGIIAIWWWVERLYARGGE